MNPPRGLGFSRFEVSGLRLWALEEYELMAILRTARILRNCYWVGQDQLTCTVNYTFCVQGLPVVESVVSSTVDALSGDYVVTQTSYGFAIIPTNWGILVKLQELGASFSSFGLGFRV